MWPIVEVASVHVEIAVAVAVAWLTCVRRALRGPSIEV